MHFLPQGVEIRPPFGVQKPHLVRRPRDDNAIPVHQRGQGLHIEIGAGIAPSDDLYGHLAHIGEHDGPVGQRVRRNRHQHPPGDRRMQQRPTRRQ